MKSIFKIALIGAALACTWPACASELPGVLSASDARDYRAIFEAQREGNIGKAESLSHGLSDKSLMGYVLAQRFLEARHYKTNFADLKSWLDDYNELPPAGRIYKLALKRRPSRKTTVPAPVSVHWRASGGAVENFVEPPMQTALGASTQARFRAFVHDGQPDSANAVLKTLTAGADITQADIDRLSAFVAASYLAEARDTDALTLAESVAEHGRANAPLADWTAGIASYRLRDYTRAASHFETVTQASGLPPFAYSGGAFWAARSYQRAGQPARVMALYARAASEPQTFYGMLAAHLLGRDIGLNLIEPSFDSSSFNALMHNKAAHRAVALHQIGQSEYVGDELARAYSDLDPGQAVAFAALAHECGEASIELKAAQVAARRGIFLTSLYPVPAYAPHGGYQLDTALMLAFARQESGFDDNAVSKSGARGVMQVMPDTAAIVGGNKKLAGKQKKRLDEPGYNMALGQKYLLDLLDRQNGNLFTLAAAYNAGPGSVSRWLAAHEGNNDPLLFVESVPAPETRRYIKQVMMNLWMYAQRFGQTDVTLDAVAAGRWPIYPQYAKTASLN